MTPEEIAEMSTPPWEAVRAALRAGDLVAAERAVNDAEERTQSLQEYSVNWITSLLSFIGVTYGEDQVEAALRRTGDEFIRPRRGDAARWDDLPAEVRARAITRAMVANGATVEVSDDDEKVTLEFRCGSGGRLIDEGRYGPNGYFELTDAGPRTFGRDRLGVYCAHCSINNEIQPIEWGNAPTTVEIPPTGPGETCTHHIYRTPNELPAEVYVRLGRRPVSGLPTGSSGSNE